jgi:hypothetical protein
MAARSVYALIHADLSQVEQVSGLLSDAVHARGVCSCALHRPCVAAQRYRVGVGVQCFCTPSTPDMTASRRTFEA